MTLPNILYIHSHDTGRSIQPYGYPATSPNLQRLAEQSVVFRQAFCAQPTCSPSRGALLTGMFPHNNGLIGLAHMCFSLNDYRQHIIHADGQHLCTSGRESSASRRQHPLVSFEKQQTNRSDNDWITTV